MTSELKVDAAPSPHQEVIKALGTSREVAEMVGARAGRRIAPQNVVMWGRRGIPWKYRLLFTELCVARGVSIPPGFLAVQGAK